MKRQIVNPFNYERPVEEVNTLPSVTQPDMVLSLREILERHSRGLPLNVGVGEEIYHGDDDFIPNLKTLDISELEALKNDVNSTIAIARAKKAEADAADVKAKQDAHIEKLVKERMSKVDQQSNKDTVDKTGTNA